MRSIEVLSAPPTHEELHKVISRVAKGESLGYLWKNESVIFGVIESAAFPQLSKDSDWNTYLNDKFSLVVNPSVMVIGKLIDIEMVVHVLDIHFVARELAALSIQQVTN